MKRVLIITYYWPPSGGGGVMRWLKMSKYLPEFGWKPVIYTPSNPDSSVYDESLLDEVHPETEEIKTPIWEPYDIYRKLTGKKKNTRFKAGYVSEASSGDWKSRLSVFIRGNFLIPDPRMFWIKPSIKFLTQYLQENPVDLIVSTGPPHSMHLIALGLKKKIDTIWIADFRDPWTDIDFYSKLRLTKWADRRHRRLEKKVLHAADHVVTVSPGCAELLDKCSNKKTIVVHNGYDPEDFGFKTEALDPEFSISHFGAFNKDRNPLSLWLALNQLTTEIPGLKKHIRIKLYGQTDESVLNAIKKNGLLENTILMEHLPHKEGLQRLSSSQVLLLPLNDAPNVKGILPGKMYEYLALNRPILSIGPSDADFAEIIAHTSSGRVHDFNDVENIKSTLRDYYNLFLDGTLQVNSTSYEQYSRRNLAKKLIELVR